MAVIRNTVLAPCTPEQAFDYLSDQRNEVEWGSTCQAVEKLTDGPVGVGTRFRAKWKGSPAAELEILTFDRPRSWTVVSRGGVDVHFTGTIEPTAAGVRVTGELRPTARGLYRLLLPVMVLLLRRDGPATEQGMREALERLHEESAQR
jgi:hypothetical protein